jgi:fluoride ion exporter CrcB/FEX
MSTRESDDRSNDDDAIDTEYDDPVTSIRSQRGNIEPPPEDMTHYRLLAHYSILVLASMAGCLIRLGLTAMGTYAGASIFPIAWSQGVGCAIMGLALARKKELTFWPPIFTFWTTGIAASITTFSTWMEEGYLAFADFNGYRRSGFYDVGHTRRNKADGRPLMVWFIHSQHLLSLSHASILENTSHRSYLTFHVVHCPPSLPKFQKDLHAAGNHPNTPSSILSPSYPQCYAT